MLSNLGNMMICLDNSLQINDILKGCKPYYKLYEIKKYNHQTKQNFAKLKCFYHQMSKMIIV